MAQLPNSIKQGGLKLETSPNATKVAYYDGEYLKTLEQIFLGVKARDDLPISLGGTWEALGTTTASSATNTFVVSNFTTNFNVYWIQLVGVTANNTATSFTLNVSSDGGTTPITLANYSFSYVVQTSALAPTAPAFSNGASAIVLPTTLQNGTTMRRFANILVFDPASSSIETNIMYNAYSFDRFTPFFTEFGRGMGVYRVAETHDSVMINITGGRTWTGGTVNVWGQSA